jgi:hypothetical protein
MKSKFVSIAQATALLTLASMTSAAFAQQWVRVANSNSNPVPINGNVVVSGTANVNVTNTAPIAVSIANNPLGVTGNVGIVGTPTVNIGTMPNVTASVTDPARTAVTIGSKYLEYPRQAIQNLYQVPSGNRLVIETASAFCAVDGTLPPWNVNINVFIQGTVVTFPIPLIQTGIYSTPNGQTYFTGYINSKFYADPLPASQIGDPYGQTMSVFGGYFGNEAPTTCNFNVSGYLVPMP